MEVPFDMSVSGTQQSEGRRKSHDNDMTPDQATVEFGVLSIYKQDVLQTLGKVSKKLTILRMNFFVVILGESAF